MFGQLLQSELGLVHLGQLGVESVLEGVDDEPVLGVDEVELFEGALGLVAGGLEPEAGAVEGDRLLSTEEFFGFDRGLDGCRREGSTELGADPLVDELGAEREATSGGILFWRCLSNSA